MSDIVNVEANGFVLILSSIQANTLSIHAKLALASMGSLASVSKSTSRERHLKGIAEIRVCKRIAVKVGHGIACLIAASCL